ncbi:MAG: sodium:calcium antiporter [Planctomycetaceae bacterium]|nr:sodium:calcium antiporter [Planctomycetaceae bacterium]
MSLRAVVFCCLLALGWSVFSAAPTTGLLRAAQESPAESTGNSSESVVASEEATTDPTAGTAVASGPRADAEDSESLDPQERIRAWLKPQTNLVLLVVLIVSIAVLGKSADWLVDLAVGLSLRLGLPRVIVGATIVSLGTTAPEAAVSVLAAINGSPGLAMGNAVGSIICDTGLILGLACLLKPLPFTRSVVNRQGWVQFGCGVLLVALSIPWDDPLSMFREGGTLSRSAGFVLVALLLIYMVWSVRLARGETATADEEMESDERPVILVLVALLAAVALVVVSSMFLIGSATLLAERFGVPESVIAATMVAFGTSLPELCIAMAAVRKNQGELAVGNIVGADILNVLFVAGLSAAVTPAGLRAEYHFFQMQFPAMLFILLVFRCGIWQASDDRLKRPFGVVLLSTYLAVTFLSYFLGVQMH